MSGVSYTKKARKSKKRSTERIITERQKPDNELQHQKTTFQLARTAEHVRLRKSIRLQQKSKKERPVKVPFLPDDIIHNVFEQLPSHSRFNTLLTSRRFCRLMVPILWRAPFITRYHNFIPMETSNLILVYISCLNVSAKLTLKQAGIVLPNSPPPLFQYQYYLKEFSLILFEKMIVDWFVKSQNLGENRKKALYFDNRSSLSESSVKAKIEILLTELSRLLFDSACLKSIKLSLTSRTLFLPEILSFSKFGLISNNVTSLELSTTCLGASDYIKDSTLGLLESLKASFTKLQILDIRCSNAHVPEYLNLIKAQNNLEKLTLRHSRLVNPVLKTLSTLSSTLTWLGFQTLYLKIKSLAILANCQNLETLVFHNIMEFDSEPSACEGTPITQSLSVKKIFIFDDFLDAKLDFKLLFQMTRNSLKELTLEILYSNRIRYILSSIVENTLDLRYLALHVKHSDIEFDKFYNWMKASKLESLVLKSKEYYFGTFVKELSIYFPETLSHLDLEFYITPGQLANFLNRCNHVSFKRIGLNDCRGITDEHLHILMKYAEYYGSLEVVEYDRWPLKYLNKFGRLDMLFGREVSFSKINEEKLKKAGRFIKVIRREGFDPFENLGSAFY
ncbi:14778_t:CDS:1 [Acaulospora morrowiae]|uniref:14778_t:CDS:1 n=1 Tax=Acaulospora morrowiae TaxID=94023 RepID=A0A9N9GBK7_9GLOM|nr:14778_t:CDS:1 [Acaulospora morrowiae]